MTEKPPESLSKFAVLLKRWADGEDITAGKTYAPSPPKKKRRPKSQLPPKRKPPAPREELVIFDEEAYAASRRSRDD